MAQDVHPEFRSEQGDVLAECPDDLGGFVAWLTSHPQLYKVVQGFSLVGGINPYGLTMFNTLQIPGLVEELGRLRLQLVGVVPTLDFFHGPFVIDGATCTADEAVVRLIEFIESNRGERNYLWFVGD